MAKKNFGVCFFTEELKSMRIDEAINDNADSGTNAYRTQALGLWCPSRHLSSLPCCAGAASLCACVCAVGCIAPRQANKLALHCIACKRELLFVRLAPTAHPRLCVCVCVRGCV